MRLSTLPPGERWEDLARALDFAENRFADWAKDGAIRADELAAVQAIYTGRRKTWEASRDQGLPPPGGNGLPDGRVEESAAARSLRYWLFLEQEVRRLADEGRLALAESHALLTELQERQAVLQRRLEPEELGIIVPPALLIDTPEVDEPDAVPEATPDIRRRSPGRPLLEILLDPRNIQMLLALGGALMVVGLVILLWVNEFFTPPVVALGLGASNAALLMLGWWLLRGTRYQLAGRALTLLAALVMPLNLWYYHANGLITIEGHLWVAAVVVSAFYAASALVLRDEVFVYIFCAGVTLTGLLLLADLPPSPQKFWEIAAPATLLVVLGLLAIHAERAFPAEEGPFGRRRFGLAFFWSGQALLAGGLLLVLGAQVAGDWLYKPAFEGLFQRLHAVPSPIVGELRWLALLLVLAGTYAYVYSDLIVRHVGVYVHIAAATLLWALVLTLQLLNVTLNVDALIAVLAITALAVNLASATLLQGSRYARALPILGVLLPLLAVGLGLVVYVRHLSPDLKSVWQVAPPAWSYVGAMLLTAISCRVGAHVYRHTQPQLAAAYFFGTAAALLVGATALLAALGLERWQEHAPILMLIPIAYLVAARLYRGHSAETPLVWVSHAATAVLLVSCLASAVEGFALVQQQPLNLALAAFFAEAALFYGLATVFYRQVGTIHLGAAMACGAVWQVLTYLGVAAEFYTLTFALVGLALLVFYRFALLERLAAGPLADAAFQSANTLLSLAFVSALFLGLSRLASHQVQWSLVSLLISLIVMALAAVVLVRHVAWRRWYVVTAIGQAGLVCLCLSVLSTLTPLQRLEIFSVVVGLLLLSAGHVGWYREQERQNDLVSVSLLLGSLLVGVPLAVATLVDRYRGHWIALNELGFLLAGILLLATGFVFQLKSTTLVGAGLTALYFVMLLIFVPWSRLNAVALMITAGGGTIFGVGLLLALYRDRLLTLPERVQRREGVFRVLNWR